MKKLTAMLLALCLLLALVPALGEGDISGTWYMTLADVNMGYVTLNADGTALADINSVGGMGIGIWKLDGDKLTITEVGGSLDFVVGEDKLTCSRFPVPFSRDAGKVTLAQMQAVLTGESTELPEGLTDTDVMTIATGFYQAYAPLVAAANQNNTATEAPTEAPTPEPTPEPTGLTTLKSNFFVYEGYNGKKIALYLAKVQNNTAGVLHVKGGHMTLKDAAGNDAGEAKYLYSVGSRYMEPGEISFLSIQADVNEGAEVADYVLEIDAAAKGYYKQDRAVSVHDCKFLPQLGSGSSNMKVIVTNDTDEYIPNIGTIVALEDADGNLLCLRTDSLYHYELAGGSSIAITLSIDSYILKYCQEHEITPAIVEAFSYAEVN